MRRNFTANGTLQNIPKLVYMFAEKESEATMQRKICDLTASNYRAHVHIKAREASQRTHNVELVWFMITRVAIFEYFPLRGRAPMFTSNTL